MPTHKFKCYHCGKVGEDAYSRECYRCGKLVHRECLKKKCPDSKRKV